MARFSMGADEMTMGRKIHTDNTFESPSDLRDWLTVERKFVRLATKRRLQEAAELAELVNAYAAGSLTAKKAREKVQAYIIRWPGVLCLDRDIAIRIESEATGFEPNPTGETPYRPHHANKTQVSQRQHRR